MKCCTCTCPCPLVTTYLLQPIRSNPIQLDCTLALPQCHTHTHKQTHITSLPLYRAPRDRMATLNKHSPPPSALLILHLPVAWIKVITQIEIVHSASSSYIKNSRLEFIHKSLQESNEGQTAVIDIKSHEGIFFNFLMETVSLRRSLPLQWYPISYENKAIVYGCVVRGHILSEESLLLACINDHCCIKY